MYSTIHRSSTGSSRSSLQKQASCVPTAGQRKVFRPSQHTADWATAASQLRVASAARRIGGSRGRLQLRVQNFTELERTPSESYTATRGGPSPLGPSWTGNGVNFALFAQHAKHVTLCLYDEDTDCVTEYPLDPGSQRSGDVWHISLEGLPGSGVMYGFKVAGDGGWDTGHRWYPNNILLDPYAPLVAGRHKWATRDELEKFKKNAGSQFWGTFDFASPAFDWGSSYSPPSLGLNELVIYEMSVRCFTADPSSGVSEEARGTYKGIIEKIPHLKSLGINAVELLPVFEYDELEFQRWDNPRQHMVNVWGYSHINFFAPMSRFGSGGRGPVAAAAEFKEMVKQLHAAGIEVILDVVYNHTAEADDKVPYTISFRGIDSSVYYMTDTSQYTQLINWSGCGNTVNANHPVVKQMILDSLVHWVEEYHVDGFRFDLASCLCRDGKGSPLPAPPLIREIAKHPLLSTKKLIAEPWDLGMFQVGSFPNWDVWAEWNGRYRDDIRRFIKGDAGMKGAFATRLAGSADLYNTNGRKPFHSINFVVAHDGFSLYDLCAYTDKRNHANGEGNNDGTNDNLAWNCGAEGPTSDGGIMALRYKQMKNFMVALIMSQGTPMMVMGDEMAKTHDGNNNWYGHDTPMAHMQWDADRDDAKAGLLSFMSELIKWRVECPLLGRAEFLGPSDITWHENDWSNAESRFLAFTLHDKGQGCGSVYAAFNAHHFQVSAGLPPPPSGHKWCRLVDTNLPSPRDFTTGGNKGVDATYGIQGHSCIVLVARPLDW